MNFSEVLASLPSLTHDQLAVVIATSQQLAANSRAGDPARARNRAARQRQAAGSGAPGPKSPYEGEPSWRAYKSADRAFKAYLKTLPNRLNSIKQFETALEDGSIPSELRGKGQTLARDLATAQDTWFRRQAELNPEKGKKGPRFGATEAEAPSTSSAEEKSRQ